MIDYLSNLTSVHPSFITFWLISLSIIISFSVFSILKSGYRND